MSRKSRSPRVYLARAGGLLSVSHPDHNLIRVQRRLKRSAEKSQRYPLWRVCLGQVYKNNPTLRILVENQGRLAYGQNINKERKGGIPGWLSSLVLPSARGVILGSRDRVPRRAPRMEPASPSAWASASLSVFLS